MFHPGFLIYFCLNGGIISEIIPGFSNEILAGKSEMRWNLNEHRAESVFNLIGQVAFRSLGSGVGVWVETSRRAFLVCDCVFFLFFFYLSTRRLWTLLKPECISHHHQQIFLGQAPFSQWTGHGRESSVSMLPGPSQPIFTGQVWLER